MTRSKFPQNGLGRLLLTGSSVGISALTKILMSADGGATSILVDLGLSTVTGSAGSLLGSYAESKYFNKSSREEILRNGDLTRAIGKAVFLICGEVGDDLENKNDAKCLRKIGKSKIEHWENLIAGGDYYGKLDLSADNIDTEGLTADRITEIATAKSKEIKTIETLEPAIWWEIVEFLADKNGCSPPDQNISKHTLKIVSKKLHKGFADALRNILVDDFNKNGEAYASFQYRMLGEILYYAKDNNTQLINNELLLKESLYLTNALLAKVEDICQRMPTNHSKDNQYIWEKINAEFVETRELLKLLKEFGWANIAISSHILEYVRDLYNLIQSGNEEMSEKVKAFQLTSKDEIQKYQDSSEQVLAAIKEVSEMLRRDKDSEISTDLTLEQKLDYKNLKAKTSYDLHKEFENRNGHFYKKYIEKVYQKRFKAHEKFENFIRQEEGKEEKKCFIVTGKAGKGKTTLFCNLALSLTQSTAKNIPLLFNSPDFRLDSISLKTEIEKALLNFSLEEICGVLSDKNVKLLIFIDAINEMEGEDSFEIFNKQMTELINEINQNDYPILFCVSCRSDFWHIFKKEDWVLRETFSPEEGLSQYPTCELENFPEKMVDSIIKTYFEWFGLVGSVTDRAREQCQDPLMLRYLCEAYTSRKSNDRETLPHQLKKERIGTIHVLQRKKVFDLFVENIRNTMFERVQKTLGSKLHDDKLVDYTTIYLINLSRVMYKNRRAYITLDEAIGVAKELKHPDADLKEFEFFTPKSIFYMFIDEGLILDKYHNKKFYFVYESYFEYSLGRYIALQRWKNLLNKKRPVSLIKKDLKILLNEHNQIIENQSFTNLLGAIQYAILVIEDNDFYYDYPELFLDLIEVMLTHENSTLVHRQKAFSTLRTTELLTKISTETYESQTDFAVHKLLEILSKFLEKLEDFVIQWDVEETLLKLGGYESENKVSKTEVSDIVIFEMEKWAEKEGSEMLQLFASQVIARLAKVDLSTVIKVINNLSSREDYRKSFWLARTLIFAISEIAKNKQLPLAPQNTEQLWNLALKFISDPITPKYTKDLSFSILPFLAKENNRYVKIIFELMESDSISIWGIWNLVYGLRNWNEFGVIHKSSWIWQLFEKVINIKNPHLDYAVYATLNNLKNQGIPETGKVMWEKLSSNPWTREKIKQSGGDPISTKKMSKTGIIYSPIYLEPTFDNHSECRQRLQAILSKLIELGEDKYNWVRPSDAPPRFLQKVHSEENDRHRDGSEWANYLKEVKRASKLFKKGEINKRHHAGPFELRYESYEVAKISAGGVMSAVDYVMKYEANSAWSLGRPPGHLANNQICIFNNIAIGAKYAQEEYGIKRILIIDCDAHHGKHTAWVFREDPNVIYFSVHIDGTYAKEEGEERHIGENEGAGYTFNILYPPNTDDRGYEYIVSELLQPLALEFEPDLIMVSAGFDGHFEDELNPGGMFSEYAYINLAKTIKDISNEFDIKVVGALEGGYGLNSFANSFVHMINVIGDWKVLPEEIGFIKQKTAILNENDEKLIEVKKSVKKRVEFMKESKKSNPKYKLFKDEKNWSKILN